MSDDATRIAQHRDLHRVVHPHIRWTQPDRIERVMRATGCTADDAREYLLAEEGDEADAILSYRCDRQHYGAVR
jgi:NACalpha-BTF3-like transcription factor